MTARIAGKVWTAARAARWGQRVFVTLAVICLGVPSWACQVNGALDFRNILTAQVVLQAQVLQVDTIAPPARRGDGALVAFTLRVERMFIGPRRLGKTVTVTGEFLRPQRAAAMVGGDFVFSLTGDRAVVVPKPDADAPTKWGGVKQPSLVLLQGTCGFGTFVFDATAPLTRGLEMLFDGRGDARAEADYLAEYLQLGRSGFY
jgi:hypothetical protein